MITTIHLNPFDISWILNQVAFWICGLLTFYDYIFNAVYCYKTGLCQVLVGRDGGMVV